MGFFDQLKDAVASMSLDETKEQSVNREFTQSQPVVKQSAPTGLYDPQLENLIDIALADGELTEKKKQILFKKAESMGIDLDEFEMVLDARVYEMQKKSGLQISSEIPKTNKLGDMQKCPSCGAIVKGGMAICVECGYAFNNVAANGTAERLYQELQRIETDVEISHKTDKKESEKGIAGRLFDSFLGEDSYEEELMGNHLIKSKTLEKKMSCISTFPIPNTRADLLETFSSIQSKVNSKGPKNGMTNDYDEDLGYAYWQMYSNCINKVKISFSNDDAFKPYLDFYEKELEKSTKKRFGFF